MSKTFGFASVVVLPLLLSGCLFGGILGARECVVVDADKIRARTFDSTLTYCINEPEDPVHGGALNAVNHFVDQVQRWVDAKQPKDRELILVYQSRESGNDFFTIFVLPRDESVEVGGQAVIFPQRGQIRALWLGTVDQKTWDKLFPGLPFPSDRKPLGRDTI